MAILKKGIVNSTKSTLDLSSPNQDRLNKNIEGLNSNNILVRVTDIVLNESHPKFNEVGQFSGIGAIFFESYTSNQPITPITSFALPCSAILRYPLINEIVTLIKSPGREYSSNSSKDQYYYLSPIQIWNTPNQNSNPILLPTKTINSNYSSNNNGEISQEGNELFTVDLNSPTDNSQEKFIEKANIRSLIPQMGDTIVEGRNGQSIRFSNNSGDPITFIRNGQNRTTPSSGFEPISEDVKNDLSSIYLTSYQNIPNLSLETEKGIPFVSYSTPPITPSQFNQPQVILNSDRIIIEAETDSVLVSAGKSVGLFSNESINLESKNINIHTDNRIRLGSKNAGESVLLGDKTYDILEFTLNILEILTDTLTPTQIYPTGAPIPDASTQAVTSTLSQAIKTVKEKVLVNIKSNKVKVE
tara:strand:- start:2176 stop:3420 length:1245 start_codon:yes stop_codon:yes gene_type:complete